jgi:hypothetical protein
MCGQLSQQLEKLKTSSKEPAQDTSFAASSQWKDSGITVAVEPGASQIILVTLHPRSKLGLLSMPDKAIISFFFLE